MAHWQQYNIEERLQLLDIASAEKKTTQTGYRKRLVGHDGTKGSFSDTIFKPF